MTNIIELLKDIGIEIPAEKLSEFQKKHSENYKTVEEFKKKISALEADRDTEKTRADNAEAAMGKFKGKTAEEIEQEIETYKQQAETAKQEAEAQIQKRDRADALKAAMEDYTFSSEAAKTAVMAQIEAADLKLNEGKFLGLKDLMDQIKEKDPSAFAGDGGSKAFFTSGNAKVPPAGTKLNPTQLMALKTAHPEINIADYI